MDRGEFRFSFVVGVRYPAIEAILRPGDGNPTYPTISAPVHFMRSDRQHFEWGFSDGDELASILQSVRVEIEGSAGKLFEHLASLNAVDLRLGPAGADWHMLGREQITGVLAAIAKLDSRDDQARQIIDDAMADPTNSKPARRRRLERLKALIR